MKTRFHLSYLIVLLFIMTIAPDRSGNAASVREVSIDEMLQMCEFVFEGKVISREAKQDRTKRIHTIVTFKIKEIIKGDYPFDYIKLSFLGGTVGDVTMMVSNMNYPEVGEHGIYFVESIVRFQVNPLYGWSQGHFLVKTDDYGTARILTKNEQPVLEIRSAPQMTSTQFPRGLSTGVARGLTLLGREEKNKGLTLSEFKKALHERLGNTK